MKLIILLKEYDLKTTTEDRKNSIINDIKDMFFGHINESRYPKPQNINNTDLFNDSSSTNYPNILNENLFDLSKLVEEYINNPNDVLPLSQIEEEFLYQTIEPYFQTLPPKFFEQWIIESKFTLPAYHLTKSGLEKITEFIDEYCNRNYYSIDLRNIIPTMTVEQIEFLSEKVLSKYFDSNELIYQIISKKFHDKLNSSGNNQEKYLILSEIYQMIKDKPAKFNSYRASLLIELLEKGELLNIYDVNLFMEYIKNPSSVHRIYNLSEEKYQRICSQQQYNIWRDNKFPNENQVISSYLRHFFMTENLEKENFSEYFEYNYLQREYFLAKLFKGEESEEIIRFFKNDEYEKLVRKTEISICNHNKAEFETESPVEIEIQLKNIQTLFVKIYEINTENYYYSKKIQFDTTISLEGLITTHESTYSFNEKPQKILRKKFELTGIPNKRGLYIVEFIGNGYSSRAVIKKGRLNLVSRSTALGKMLFILNEKSEICISEKTGVWYLDTFYKCHTQTGHITIPYFKQTFNEPIIVVHEDFAELSHLEVQYEKYELKGAFHLNNESLMLGNTAKILFKPFLYVNGNETNIEYLKNSKITAKLTKVENDNEIPITQTFEKLNISRGKEIEIELQIPPKLKDIQLIFRAEVKNKSKNLNESLSVNHFIELNSFEEDKQFTKLFLRKTNDLGYVVSLLGKNGEAKSNAQIELNFYLKNTSRKFQATLQTNYKGEITLGKLDNVTRVTAWTYYLDKQINNQWTIPDRVQISYPNSIDITLNESISLPFHNSEIDKKNISLIKTGKDLIIEDCFNKIKLIPVNEENTRFKIQIDNLEKGEYELIFPKIKVSIKITVHEGKIWEGNKNFIITSDKIIENCENRNPIFIKNFTIKPSENQEYLFDVHIKIGSNTKNARLHLFAYQFLHSDSNEFYNKIKNIIDSYSSNNVHSFQKWKSSYLSNRLLNEEIQYVFDRKHLERVMGNSLVKPSLLLKRKFIRETTTEEESINEGEEYIQDESFRKDEKLSKSKKKKVDKRLKRNEDSILRKVFSDFHNFLAFSPLTITNISFNESGEISIKNLRLSEFSQIQFVALDERSICYEIISLDYKDPRKRNLTLLKSLNPEKTYSEIRKIESFNTNNPIEISDITSTDFKIFDSLEKVLNYNLLVNPNFNPDWEKFSFLLKLNEMSEEEQKKNISNFFSNELNVFCYFKYPDIFNKFIQPVIKFKSEKCFLDFFLLNDKENLTKFTRTDNLSKLNALEKCLLIITLGKENPELAKNIKNLIFTIADKNKPKGQELKKLFNIIMDMKISEQEDLQEQVDFVKKNKIKMDIPVMYACTSALPQLEKCLPRSTGMMQMEYDGGSCMVEADCEELHGDIFDYAENQQIEDDSIALMNIRNNLNVKPGKTAEYNETHYFFTNNNDILENSSLFWYDFALYLINNEKYENFLSENVILPAKNVIDLIFILSVIDLPFFTLTHKFNRKEGRALEVIPVSNAILFTKEISEAKSKILSKLMIAQNVVDIANENNPEQLQVKEFLLNKIYVHETIVTNISSRYLSFELIIQIPEGGIPVNNSEYTKTIHLSLEKFNTKNYKTYFYFPEKTGKFKQYPPNVAIDGIVVAKGDMLTYEVVESIRTQSKENLDNILITGSKKDILEYFDKSENIKDNHINKVIWLLKEKDFYREFLLILRKKGIYNESVWNFSFYHKDSITVKEVLETNDRIKQAVGPIFKSTLLKVDDTNNHDIKFHLDYNPIFNARVHKLGRENKTILNKELRETYENFVIYLLRLNENEIDSKHYIRLCYYLILQDRIEDALKIFSRINTTEFNKNSSLLMQYDYIAAYLDFSIGYPDFKIAKEICGKYKNFPLTHWRELFEEIEDQLIEYEGKEIYSDMDELLDEEKRKKQLVKNVIQSEPNLVFTIEKNNKTSELNITYSNLDYIVIKFYLIDLEILFSRNPFIKSNSSDFSFVQPNFIQKIKLEKTTQEKDYIFAIPKEFHSKNLFIEISTTNKKAFDTYFSTLLKVIISENLGEVKITDSNKKPLNKVYVKVFAKINDNSVKFYKDGYTDLRGKFNYIQLNTDQLKSVAKFAVLIIHDDYGSIIKECNPPVNIKRDQNPNNSSDYENFDNFRKEARQVWRTKNKGVSMK